MLRYSLFLAIFLTLPVAAQTISFKQATVALPCTATTDSFFEPDTNLVAGDFNGDHKTDLAVLCGDRILILLGKGDGTFQAPQAVAVNRGNISYSALQAVDVNRDGRTDLAVTSIQPTVPSVYAIEVFLSKGDGTFQLPVATLID